MAKRPNVVGVTGPIAPKGTEDTYPSHLSEFGKGGVHSVADVTARNDIKPERREQGMLCFVVGTQTLYQLKGGILNTHWVVFTSGGGGGASYVEVEVVIPGSTNVYNLAPADPKFTPGSVMAFVNGYKLLKSMVTEVDTDTVELYYRNTDPYQLDPSESLELVYIPAP